MLRLNHTHACRILRSQESLTIDYTDTRKNSATLTIFHRLKNSTTESEEKKASEIQHQLISMTFRYQDFNNPSLPLLFSMHREENNFQISMTGSDNFNQAVTFTIKIHDEQNVINRIATLAGKISHWLENKGKEAHIFKHISKKDGSIAMLLEALFTTLDNVTKFSPSNTELMSNALDSIPLLLKSALTEMKRSEGVALETPAEPSEESKETIDVHTTCKIDGFLDVLIGGVLGAVSKSYFCATQPNGCEDNNYSKLAMGLSISAGACAIPLLKWLVRECCACSCQMNFFSSRGRETPVEASSERKLAPASVPLLSIVRQN